MGCWLDAPKTDHHNHERDYVETWAEQLRIAIEKLQPSLRPEILKPLNVKCAR